MLSRLVLRASALALTAVAACSGGSTEPPPPPSPKASLEVTFTPNGFRVVSSCLNSVSASRSWSASTAPSADEVVPLTPGTTIFNIVCRNAAGLGVQAQQRMTVLMGRFAAYNSGLGFLGGERVYATGSAGTDSADVNPDGSWLFLLRSENDATITFRADAKDPANRRFFPWEITLQRIKNNEDRWSKPILYTRVPMSWPFTGGAYASAPARALSLHWDGFNPNSPAGELLTVTRSGDFCMDFRSETWSNFPVPVAFDRERSNQPVSAADSAAYWQRLEAVEAELGWDAWRPANFSEMSYVFLGGQEPGTEDTWSGVLVRALAQQASAGTWFRGNDVVRGLVMIGITFLDKWAGPHETAHTLRVNHAQWEESLMFPAGSEFKTLGSRTTAVIQLLYADANAVRALGPGAKSGLIGSLMGERRLLNVPVEPICDP